VVERKSREDPINDIRKVENNIIDYRLPIDISNPGCEYQLLKSFGDSTRELNPSLPLDMTVGKG